MKFQPKTILKLSIFIFVALATVFGFAAYPAHVSAQYYNGNCSYHSYQRCNGNYLYWYDSCGNQEDSQYCSNGCYNNYCQNNNNNNYNNYGNCTYHAYQLCAGNNIYWYNSCGTQQDFVQSCSGTNIVCKYGQCVYQQPYVAPAPKPVPVHRIIPVAPVATPVISVTTKLVGLTVSFFAKQDQTSTQWQKTAQIGPNGQVYFMISVVNNSAVQIENVNVAANIPSEITSLGNLQINGVLVSGDIISGVNIGALSPGNAKSITFEGKSGAIASQITKQAMATVSAAEYSPQSDSVSLILSTVQAGSGIAPASVVSSPATGFWDFIKKWYLWILVGLVLIFLFIIVFRRLSNNS